MARREPVRFATEVLRLTILPGEPKPGTPRYRVSGDWSMCDWQIELLEAVADVERERLGIPTRFNHEGKTQITARACQGPGKTFGIAVLAHIWGFAYDPIVIPVIAPKKEHVKTRFFAEFSEYNRQSRAPTSLSAFAVSDLGTTGFAGCFTAVPRDA